MKRQVRRPILLLLESDRAVVVVVPGDEGVRKVFSRKVAAVPGTRAKVEHEPDLSGGQVLSRPEVAEEVMNGCDIAATQVRFQFETRTRLEVLVLDR